MPIMVLMLPPAKKSRDSNYYRLRDRRIQPRTRIGAHSNRGAFLNSAPWPLPGHPEAMKMDPSP
jgi:hypothetical protein